MKRIKNLLPALMLVFAALTAFAFQPIENKNREALVCVWYDYIGPQPATLADAHDPNNWQLFVGTPPPPCPGQGELCAICVDPSEIYDGGEFDGLPMVDDNTTDIYDALETSYIDATGEWTDVTVGTATVEAFEPE